MDKKKLLMKKRDVILYKRRLLALVTALSLAFSTSLSGDLYNNEAFTYKIEKANKKNI